MVQFLAPETDIKFQFLAQKTVEMGQQNFWRQKLTKWFSFWGQKPYFMGEWNYITYIALQVDIHVNNNKFGSNTPKKLVECI